MAEAPSPKPRSRKLYVLWGVALTLLISTALFCWLVVVPVLEVRSVMHRYNHGHIGSAVAIEELGGTAKAARRLGTYLRLPHGMAPARVIVPHLLDDCVPADPKGVLNTLRLAMEDTDADVRFRCLYTLALFGEEHREEVVTLLIDVGMGDPSPRVRMMSARLLGVPGANDPPRVQALIRALSDEYVEVRMHAAHALGAIGEGAASAIHALAERHKDPLPEPRAAAARALGEITIGNVDALKGLARFAADPDGKVRQAAAASLKKIKAPSTSSGQAAQETNRK